MAAIQLANAVGGVALPRLHLGRGVRDHPRGGGRPDARGRLGRQPRSLRLGDRQGNGVRGQGGAHLEDLRGRDRHRRRSYLGYVFENQNVAFMVGLAFAVAASCNFPVLLMSVFWKGTTTRGVLIGGFLGLDQRRRRWWCLSPAVWVRPSASRARSSPTTIRRCSRWRIAFGGIWLFSKTRQPASGRPRRSGRLRRAIRPLGDRHRRVRRGRALTEQVGAC